MEDNNVIFLFNKNKLINNFIEYNKLGVIYYPLKTNSNKFLIQEINKLIDKHGGGFLISNIDHFNKLKKINVESSKICLINVLSSNPSTKYLYDNGVRFFVFDNLDSLNSFVSYADLKQCKISIRINTMEVFNDTLMHLGASTDECTEMLNLLNNKCKKVGVSFYLQTKIKNELNAMGKMLSYINHHFNNFNLDFISIAGVKKYSELDYEYLNKIKLSMNLDEIILEPGKYLVGNAFDMLTKVIRFKKLKNKSIVVIKNGIYSGLLDVLLYNEKFKIYFKSQNNNYIEFSYNKDTNHNYEIYMCGGSSDSGDVIGIMYINEKYKDEIKVGTEILIKDIGSYFEEFFMPYGGDINKIYMEVDKYEV